MVTSPKTDLHQTNLSKFKFTFLQSEKTKKTKTQKHHNLGIWIDASETRKLNVTRVYSYNNTVTSSTNVNTLNYLNYFTCTFLIITH